LEDLEVDGRIKLILKESGLMMDIEFNWLGIGTNVVSCEHGNETLGFHKRRENLVTSVTVSFFIENPLDKVTYEI
jgi:hypothetical protein